MVAKFRTVIKLILYFIINLFIKSSKEITHKSLVLIRLDAIGDYILFRNFIEIIKKSEKYKDYSITLIGNSAWKDLAEELDSEFINNFIWLDRTRFSKNLFYRYRKLKEISSNGYQTLISSVFSRTFFYDDNIVKLINAKEKIGSVSNTSNIDKWQIDISDNYYTRLIHTKEELMFEFYRNKLFFESLLETKLNIIRPIISLKIKHSKFQISKKYAILFIGGSEKYKKWSIENFAKIGNYLKKKYGFNIVICGSSKDSKEANELQNKFESKILNLVGKTTLIELMEIINNADLILSNETSAPHISAALNLKNIFVIYSGKHLGRFIPYPKKISDNHHIIYHPFIYKNFDNYTKLSNSYSFFHSLNINEITPEIVKNKIDENLKNSLF
jgi:ADP-heptose:LPS heptosyltransferase